MKDELATAVIDIEPAEAWHAPETAIGGLEPIANVAASVLTTFSWPSSEEAEQSTGGQHVRVFGPKLQPQEYATFLLAVPYHSLYRPVTYPGVHASNMRWLTPASHKRAQSLSGLQIAGTDAVPPALAANLAALAVSGLSDATNQQIVAISKKQDGWKGVGSKRLRSASLSDFLTLWQEVKRRASEPFVSLAPNGNLIAHWHQTWKRHLDVEFAEKEMVYFALFDGPSALQGRTELRELIGSLLVRKSNPFRWKRNG